MYILNCIFLLLRCSTAPGKNMKDVWKSRWKESDIGSPFFYSTLIRFIVYTHTPLSACCGLSSKTFGWLYSRRPWGVVLLVYITKIVFGCARGFYISSLLCHTHTHNTECVCCIYSLSFFMSESITLYYVYVRIFSFVFTGLFLFD